MEKYYVKIIHESEKRWSYITSSGGTSFAKIHAAVFEGDKVDAFIAENAPDNPDFQFKKVPVIQNKKPVEKQGKAHSFMWPKGRV